MVVSVGGVPVAAKSAAVGARRTEPARRSRRDVTRGLVASAIAVALAPVVAASRPRGGGEPPTDTAFDEVYRGHRIRGARERSRGATGVWQVTVDGRPLHLMRRADGTWLTMVDHFRSYPTPLEAARAAVDELGPGQRLRAPGTTHTGGHHGVHA